MNKVYKAKITRNDFINLNDLTKKIKTEMGERFIKELNYEIMYTDYIKVRNSIKNPNNKLCHNKALKRMIELFENKWKGEGVKYFKLKCNSLNHEYKKRYK